MNWDKAIVGFMLRALVCTGLLGVEASLGQAQTLDEVYKTALKEGGALNFYSTLAQSDAAKILPAFERRFPGIKVNHVDATADKLVARVIAESRGGKVLADYLQFGLENMVRVYEQGLLLEKLPPEAAAYPDSLKGSYWLASDLIFAINAWNTNLVKKEDEPKQLDDFADPKWKSRLMSEPRSAEMLIGLKHKYNSEEKASAVLRRIAANSVEFHKGYSQLTELLVAGQAAGCIACRSHHFPPRIKKGAPLGYLLTEGVGQITAAGLLKGGPHPNTAWLFWRWAASEEGQKVFALGGRTPAHPKVEPIEKTRPEKIYPIGITELKEWSKYEKVWKEIFKLR